VESQATEGRSGVFERKVVQAAEALIMRRSGTIARKNVTHGASLQLVSIRRGAWHTRCFIFPCRVSRRGYGRGSMKAETIVLRSLYAMTALVVVFGVCAFLIQVH